MTKMGPKIGPVWLLSSIMLLSSLVTTASQAMVDENLTPATPVNNFLGSAALPPPTPQTPRFWDNLPAAIRSLGKQQQIPLMGLAVDGVRFKLQLGNPYLETVEAGLQPSKLSLADFSLHGRLTAPLSADTIFYAGAAYRPRNLVQTSMPLRQIVMAQTGLLYRVNEQLNVGLGYDFVSSLKQGSPGLGSGLLYVGWQPHERVQLQLYQTVGISGDKPDQGIRVRFGWQF